MLFIFCTETLRLEQALVAAWHQPRRRGFLRKRWHQNFASNQVSLDFLLTCSHCGEDSGGPGLDRGTQQARGEYLPGTMQMDPKVTSSSCGSPSRQVPCAS